MILSDAVEKEAPIMGENSRIQWWLIISQIKLSKEHITQTDSGKTLAEGSLPAPKRRP